MQGLEITGENAGELSGQIIKTAQKKGLLILRSGKSVLRFLPPLVIEEAEITEGIKILKEIFEEIKG